jgi:hypothetical protein
MSFYLISSAEDHRLSLSRIGSVGPCIVTFIAVQAMGSRPCQVTPCDREWKVNFGNGSGSLIRI